jgi:hypothetical protein
VEPVGVGKERRGRGFLMQPATGRRRRRQQQQRRSDALGAAARTGGRGEHDAVRLHARHKAPALVALDVGQERVGAAVDDHLVEHLVRLSGLPAAGAHDVALKAGGGGVVGRAGGCCAVGAARQRRKAQAPGAAARRWRGAHLQAHAQRDHDAQRVAVHAARVHVHAAGLQLLGAVDRLAQVLPAGGGGGGWRAGAGWQVGAPAGCLAPSEARSGQVCHQSSAGPSINGGGAFISRRQRCQQRHYQQQEWQEQRRT